MIDEIRKEADQRLAHLAASVSFSEAQIHPDADDNHCLACGRRAPSEHTGAYGIIGLRYAESQQQIVACKDHRRELHAIKEIARSRPDPGPNPHLMTP